GTSFETHRETESVQNPVRLIRVEFENRNACCERQQALRWVTPPLVQALPVEVLTAEPAGWERVAFKLANRAEDLVSCHRRIQEALRRHAPDSRLPSLK